MPFIRLSDDYIDNPKIEPLSDGAFRLWHQALAYCRRHQTDGLIPRSRMLTFPNYRSKRLTELMTSYQGRDPLVSKVDSFGFKLHDYLEWNPSRDEENERRGHTKERMRHFRERRRDIEGAPGTSLNSSSDAVTSSVTNGARTPFVTEALQSVTNANVLGRERVLDSGKGSGENPLEERAHRLRTELYPAWYSQYRKGARLRIPLIANSLEYQDALSLVSTWDDDRLEKLAKIVLTTDDDWISRTDRGWRIFVLKAAWADDRLKQAENAA